MDVVLGFHEQGATIYYNGSNAVSQQVGQLCRRQLQQDALFNLAAANAIELSGRITVMDADEGKKQEEVFFLFYFLLHSILQTQGSYPFTNEGIHAILTDIDEKARKRRVCIFRGLTESPIEQKSTFVQLRRDRRRDAEHGLGASHRAAFGS